MSSDKEITVGYKYFAGIHFILAYGVFDKLVGIEVDDRELWQGAIEKGRLSISKADLFGGNSREGGVEGELDFLNGDAEQQINDYLQTAINSPLLSNFKRVSSVVLRKMYLGNNPYLKKWKFKAQRIHKKTDGSSQWYDSKSEISVGGFERERSILIAFNKDSEYEQSPIFTTTEFFNAVKNAIYRILDDIEKFRLASGQIVNVCIDIFGGDSRHIIINNIQTSDIQILKDWVVNTSYSPRTFSLLTLPFETAYTFFDTIGDGKQRDIILISKGSVKDNIEFQEALDQANDFIDKIGGGGFLVDAEGNVLPGNGFITPNTPEQPGTFSEFNKTAVNVHAIQIGDFPPDYLPSFDNVDGFTQIEKPDEHALYSKMQSVLGDHAAMNPAHIIRECLTDSDWGMGYEDSAINDESFKQCADVLYNENLGMSLLWTKQTSIESFIDDIKRHINAELYVDRSDGRFVLKLVRDDYDESTLLEFNTSNVQKVSKFKKPAFGELTTAVTVNFWNLRLGENSTISIKNSALGIQQGFEIESTVDYLGFVDAQSAAKAGQRDLNVLSRALTSTSIFVGPEFGHLNPGDVVKLTWPDYDFATTVMRVVGLNLGTEKNKTIEIELIQDVFSTPDVLPIVESEYQWEDPSLIPSPVEHQIAVEAPYLELARVLGEVDANAQLNFDNFSGALTVAAARPGNAFNGTLYIDSGTGFEESTVVDFCPFCVLNEDIDEMQTVFAINQGIELENVTLGSWFQVDDELMTVSAISDTELTCKRAVLDTVPAKHSVGSKAFFWEVFGETDTRSYVSGEVLNTRISTTTGAGVLPISAALNVEMIMNHRAFRPFPPGNVQLNGEYFPDSINGDIVLTWVDRNRLQQTGDIHLGFVDAGVTVEPGTTYDVKIINSDNDVLILEEIGITSPHTIPELGFQAYVNLRIELYSKRDGEESLFKQVLAVSRAPSNNQLSFDNGPYTPPAGGSANIQFD